LVCAVANVLDNGIAEHDIKRIFLKWQQKAIARDTVYGVRAALYRAGEIQDGKTRSNGQKLPDGRRAPDVENANGRGDLEGFFKQPHPSGAKISKRVSKQVGIRHSLEIVIQWLCGDDVLRLLKAPGH
jgi:hypothetical protein